MAGIYNNKDGPRFTWDAGRLVSHLSAARYEQGLLLGKMRGLGYRLKEEATLAALTEETVKSSAIEGEELNPESVRSSLARRMGLEAGGTQSTDRNVEGIVEMMLDATENYRSPLTEERIFGWHAALFPTGRSGVRSALGWGTHNGVEPLERGLRVVAPEDRLEPSLFKRRTRVALGEQKAGRGITRPRGGIHEIALAKHQVVGGESATRCQDPAHLSILGRCDPRCSSPRASETPHRKPSLRKADAWHRRPGT